MRTTYFARLACHDVGNLDFFRRGWIAIVLCTNGCAIQTDAHGIAGIVQPRVIHFRGDDVLHAVARSRTRNQKAHQQTRYGCLSIREVENIRFFTAALRGEMRTDSERLAMLLLVGTIPAAVLGVFLESRIKSLFASGR